MPFPKLLPPILMLLALSAAAAAQTSQDILGIFFDTGGTVTEANTSTPDQAVEAWLLLLDPGHDDGLYSWEGVVQAQTSGTDPYLGFALEGSAINVLTAPEFAVGLAQPLPLTPVVSLARVIIVVPDPGQEIALYLHPLAEPSMGEPAPSGYPVHTPCYAHGADLELVSLGWSSGCEFEPVAWINRDADDPVLELELPQTIRFDITLPGEVAIQEFSILNRNGADLSGTVSLAGEGFLYALGLDGYFTSGEKWFRIQANSTLPVTVRFAPDKPDLYSGQLVFTSCDRQWTVALSDAGGLCTWEPPLLDFGEQECYSTGTLSSLLTNNSQTTVVLDISELNSSYLPDYFFISGYGDIYLAPGDSREVAFVFHPTAERSYTWELANFGNPLTLAGIGIPPSPSICSVTPEILDFGIVDIGEESAKYFYITNEGGGLLQGTPAVVDGNGVFSLQYNFPYALESGESEHYWVRFTPTAIGDYSGLALPGTGCSAVLLKGSCRDFSVPVCSVSPELLDFGEIVVGDTSVLPLTIRNLGDGLLTGEIALTDDTGAFFLETPDCSYSLERDQAKTFSIGFHSAASGEFSALVATGAECADVPMQGSSWEPVWSYAVSRDSLDFGEVTLYTSAPYEIVVISNSGDTSLYGNLELLGSPAFSASTSGSYTIPPGYSRYIRFYFEPDALGDHLGTALLGLPGAEEVALHGVGVLPTEEHDLAGIFFDQNYLVTSHTTLTEPAVVESYLILLQPSTDQGVSGWECCLDVAGDAFPIQVECAGTVTGDLDLYCNHVELAEPLPGAAAIVLAKILLLVPTINESGIELHPYSEPSLPGSMVYWDGSPPQKPIAMVTTTGVPLVATINGDDVVASPVPGAPSAQVDAQNVQLRWNCSLPVEGYNVYRRSGSASPRKLNPEPLACLEGTGHFTDQASDWPVGPLFYSLSAVIDGRETMHGPEVKVLLPGAAPARTRLLPGYPNPFNPQTTLPYELSRVGKVRLGVYDLAGRRVRLLVDASMPAGSYTAIWLGRDDAGRPAPSGVYYFRLETDFEVLLQKGTLLK